MIQTFLFTILFSAVTASTTFELNTAIPFAPNESDEYSRTFELTFTEELVPLMKRFLIFEVRATFANVPGTIIEIVS